MIPNFYLCTCTSEISFFFGEVFREFIEILHEINIYTDYESNSGGLFGQREYFFVFVVLVFSTPVFCLGNFGVLFWCGLSHSPYHNAKMSICGFTLIMLFKYVMM